VDALAGVAPVFPLVSLVLAIAQGAIGGGIVTTVARALGAGRISDASEYAWYAVALGIPLGLATTVAMYAWVQAFTAIWASLEMLSRSLSPIHPSLSRAPY
jgi:Na+-driven multidrug efflux pump